MRPSDVSSSDDCENVFCIYHLISDLQPLSKLLSILTAMNNLEKTLCQLLSRLTSKIMLYLLADFLNLGEGSNTANFKTFYQGTQLLKKTSLVILA